MKLLCGHYMVILFEHCMVALFGQHVDIKLVHMYVCVHEYTVHQGLLCLLSRALFLYKTDPAVVVNLVH